MPARDAFSPGEPCWIDLSSQDIAAARAFYPSVLGWTAGEPNPDFGGYFMFLRDGVPVAGGMGKMPGDEGTPSVWVTYLSVTDAAATTARATARGAQTIVDPMPVGDLGVMGMVADPAGAAIGLWQPGTFAGFGVTEDPGAPTWFELNSRAYDVAVPFYVDVFGWDAATTSDTPQFRYTVARRGDAQVAGVLDAAASLPAGVPSHWTVYVRVADPDQAAAVATASGGTVVREPWDSPFGRLAVLADPAGAAFTVIGPAAAPQ